MTSRGGLSNLLRDVLDRFVGRLDVVDRRVVLAHFHPAPVLVVQPVLERAGELFPVPVAHDEADADDRVAAWDPAGVCSAHIMLYYTRG